MVVDSCGMELENAEIIILSPNFLDTCILPLEKNGRFWLYRRDETGKKKMVELWGKKDAWYLLKNHRYEFPSDSKEEIKLIPPYQLCLYQETDCFYLLYHKSPPSSYQHYVLHKECCYQIGRDKENDICIQDAMVSAIHALLCYEDETWYVMDEHSSNGVYVNSKRVNKAALYPGDLIQIMQYRFIFGIDTLMVSEYKDMSIQLTPGVAKLQKPKRFLCNEVLPAIHPRILCEPFQLEIEMPFVISESKKTPFLLSAGPSFTMGLSSMAMGVLSLYQAHVQKQPISSILPTLFMSISMAMTMMLWPVIVRIYEQRQEKREKKKQEMRYLSYIKKCREDIYGYMQQEQESRASLYEDTKQALEMLKHTPWLVHARNTQEVCFLMLCLGKGDLPSSIELKYSKEPFLHPMDASWEAYIALKEERFILRNQSICLDLKKERRIGIYGNQAFCIEYMMDKLLQLILLHDLHSFRCCVLIDQERLHHYPIQFLPCLFYGQIRLLVCEKEDAKQVDFALREWWSQKDEEEYLILFSFDRFLEEQMGCLSSLLKEDHVIYLQCAPSIQLLHPECDRILELKDPIQMDQLMIKADRLSSKDFKAAMSDYQKLNFFKAEQRGFPSHFSFLDMYQCGNIEQLQILQRWKKPKATLEACIGIDEHREIITLDMHEHFHGPHGLIAGMTGSGKSEWIITLLLSLAVEFSPLDISFVLIDYKGGGMAQAFHDLPHVAGIMTNLNEEQILRSIQGIQSELTRRQRLFKQSQELTHRNVMHIDQYRQLYREGALKEPLSHILIIADEFAELKQQQPSFMEDLKQIARIGRSLGVHLLLATQKPNGVVDDQIWSNARFHVCLKVQDKMDSMEMLKKEDAIYLKEAGMFYLQVGYDEHFVKGLGAWTNAPYVETDHYEAIHDQSMTIISTTGTCLYEKQLCALPKDTKTQLEVITAYISELAKQHSLHADALWLQDLEEQIPKEYLMDQYRDPRVFALLDDPAHQRREPLVLDLSGHMAVVGVREEDMQMMLYAMLSSVDTNDTIVYLLDQQHHTKLTDAIDDEILYDNQEKMESYLYVVEKQLKKQKQQKTKQVMLSFCMHYDLMQHSQYQESFLSLIKEGKNYGIYFCLFLQSPYALTYQLKGQLSSIYCLYVKERDDYHSMFHSSMEVYPGKQIGRGVIEKDQCIYQFQCAQVTSWHVIPRKQYRIPVLPEHISYKDKAGYYYVGMETGSKQDVWIKKETPFLILCDYDFDASFLQVMKKQGHSLMYTREELQLHLQEEPIKKSIAQGVILWNGTGLSNACYLLNLPYFKEEGINGKMGVLWENEEYHIIRLVEDLENG